LFAFPTEVPNFCNSYTNAIPKVGVHLRVIGLHPLYSPPFVRAHFTPKHILGLMGPCTSRGLVANLMLGLRHYSSSYRQRINILLLKVLKLKKQSIRLKALQFEYNELT